jgi:hypothetical protein
MMPTLKIDCMASTDCHRSGYVVSKEFMVKSRHHMNENDNYWRIRREQNDRGNKVCTSKASYGKQCGSIASVANTNMMIPLEDITKRPHFAGGVVHGYFKRDDHCNGSTMEKLSVVDHLCWKCELKIQGIWDCVWNWKPHKFFQWIIPQQG